ncbi:tetratricopeptide repeat protein [Streptomyces mangrovisoli]|uniref:Tetratricopeptide repeat protein n=1 Tax=Streptomyces mangrovisoli TaxID=1428628 RepID=A0A1J4P5U2_9ACTN|nr:tetratricopeptide repeat protein [Streptomyces mangrovisoli]OIJ69140.1 hypothetical protein WN71_004180 [Streptomyces mangrovisoli]
MPLFRSRSRRVPASALAQLAEASALFKVGRFADAENEARRVAAMQPERHNHYAPMALSVAAMAMGAQGRHDEAVTAYDELLPVFGRIYGAEHWLTLKLRSDRAQTLAALGRYVECEAECGAVFRTAARTSGEQAPLLVASARNGLIFAVNGQGRHQEAERLAREALAEHETPDRFRLVLLLGLARALNGQGRHEEALAEVARIRELPSAEQHVAQTGATEIAEATALAGLGRTDEARAGAQGAYDTCLAALGPGHARTAEARELVERLGGVRH